MHITALEESTQLALGPLEESSKERKDISFQQGGNNLIEVGSNSPARSQTSSLAHHRNKVRPQTELNVHKSSVEVPH